MNTLPSCALASFPFFFPLCVCVCFVLLNISYNALSFCLEVIRKFLPPNDSKGQLLVSLMGLVKSPCIRSSAVFGNGGSTPETPGCHHLLD